MPSTTSTAWVMIGGTASGRPAIAATPIAIIAPEIRPPGRLTHRNSRPPAVPIASVSSCAEDFGAAGNGECQGEAREAWFASRRLMANPASRNKCANAVQHCAAGYFALSAAGAGWIGSSRAFALTCAGLCSVPGEGDSNAYFFGLRFLDAVGAEFLALLAMQPLGVGFLGAFERLGAVCLLGLRRLGCGFGCGGRRACPARKRSPRAGAKRRRQRPRGKRSSSWKHL